MNIEAEKYNEFVDKLGDIKDFNGLEEKIESRLQEFIKVGTTAADVALQSVYPVTNRAQAEKIFNKRRKGKSITENDCKIFKGYLTYFLFKLYAKYNITTELHIGAMRNNNSQMLVKLGLDTGYDSIAEDNSIKYMSRLFDRLNSENLLPKTIVFNLNPKMNSEIMTLIGCFQGSDAKGKIQYGPAWWFLDNKIGMEKHLEDLTATGHIATFVGMLTDSRSFLSYPRHHYFRKILCNYLGKMIERGEMTSDEKLVGKVIEEVWRDGGKLDSWSEYFSFERWIDAFNECGLDPDFYARVNFTSLIKVVDALGGVKVYSEYSFKENINGQEMIVSKGWNYFNGEQALAFCRERKQLSGGDYQRGKNQEAVLKAIIEKLLSPAVLTGASDLLNSVKGNVETNMSMEQIQELIKSQLDDPQPWTIEMMAAYGKGDMDYCYSMPGTRLYVSWPDESSVNSVKQAIQNIMDYHVK